MKDNRLHALFERAKRKDTPEEERRTSAVLVVEEMARRGSMSIGTAADDLAEAFARQQVVDLRHEIEGLRMQLRERAVRRNRLTKIDYDIELMAKALEENAYIEVYEARQTTRRRYLATRLVPKPLAPSERVKKALAELAARGNEAPSDREVARLADLSPTTVGKLRRELGPVPNVRRGHDGKERKVPSKPSKSGQS